MPENEAELLKNYKPICLLSPYLLGITDRFFLFVETY
jgi:hypothetical protein